MKFDFDTYEFAGLVAPGSVVVLALIMLHPEDLRGIEGVVLVAGAALAAYILGHLIAAIGNCCALWFKPIWGRDLGMATARDWKGYCSGGVSEVAASLGKGSLAHISLQQWAVKRMHIVVLRDCERCASRLETFNGLYNLSRGLTVAFIIDAAILCAASHWAAASFCVFAATLARYRATKFKDIYNRELVQQFLLVKLA